MIIIVVFVCVQYVPKAGGVLSAQSHVTAVVEVTVCQWMDHVTAFLDGKARTVKQVRFF